MKDRRLSFDKKVELIERKNDKESISCEFLLRVDGETFDPEEDYDDSKKIRDHMYKKYLRYFEKLCPEGHIVAVKLSGIHVDFVGLFKNFTFAEDSRNHAIFHYHHWKVDNSEAVDENAYMIIKCNDSLFKELFHRYWFSIDAECHFEGIILRDEDSVYLEKWSRLDENDMKKSAMINTAFLTFDNLHNGFHFQICTDKKSSAFFDLPVPATG